MLDKICLRAVKLVALGFCFFKKKNIRSAQLANVTPTCAISASLLVIPFTWPRMDFPDNSVLTRGLVPFFPIHLLMLTPTKLN